MEQVEKEHPTLLNYNPKAKLRVARRKRFSLQYVDIGRYTWGLREAKTAYVQAVLLCSLESV
jgi:hypothetical protein